MRTALEVIYSCPETTPSVLRQMNVIFEVHNYEMVPQNINIPMPCGCTISSPLSVPTSPFLNVVLKQAARSWSSKTRSTCWKGISTPTTSFLNSFFSHLPLFPFSCPSIKLLPPPRVTSALAQPMHFFLKQHAATNGEEDNPPKHILLQRMAQHVARSAAESSQVWIDLLKDMLALRNQVPSLCSALCSQMMNHY